MNSLNTTLKDKKILTWERDSFDKKSHHKEKISISINNDPFEKLNTQGNYYSKNVLQTLSSRPTSFQKNQRQSTVYSNNTSNIINNIKNSLKIPPKIDNNTNVLALSNQNIR